MLRPWLPGSRLVRFLLTLINQPKGTLDIYERWHRQGVLVVRYQRFRAVLFVIFLELHVVDSRVVGVEEFHPRLRTQTKFCKHYIVDRNQIIDVVFAGKVVVDIDVVFHICLVYELPKGQGRDAELGALAFDGFIAAALEHADVIVLLELHDSVTLGGLEGRCGQDEHRGRSC
ncbi:uncharacterized protein PG998_014337 [Apiospora kogelbergensis]|uniref:uncharacterized protein n=1 Tax=Apiospora kogelbergensis TaxID=1337665 RepID=UPI00312DED87